MNRHKSLIDKLADWATEHFKSPSLNPKIEYNENNHYQFRIGDHIRPKEKSADRKTISDRMVLGAIEDNYFLQVSCPIESKERKEGVKKVEIYPKSFIEKNFKKTSLLQ